MVKTYETDYDLRMTSPQQPGIDASHVFCFLAFDSRARRIRQRPENRKSNARVLPSRTLLLPEMGREETKEREECTTVKAEKEERRIMNRNMKKKQHTDSVHKAE